MTGRRVVLCEADFACCPSCNTPLYRTMVWAPGGIITTCGHRATGATGARCSQPFLATGIAGGLCLVVPLTHEEATALRAELLQMPVTPGEICKRLGLLRRPLVAAG